MHEKTCNYWQFDNVNGSVAKVAHKYLTNLYGLVKLSVLSKFLKNSQENLGLPIYLNQTQIYIPFR